MTPEKIKKWKENREAALDLYHTTNMNIAQIARALRLSTTTVDRMITGKNLPKGMEGYMDKAYDDKEGFTKEETKIIETAVEKINEILTGHDVYLRDGTLNLIELVISRAITKQKNNDLLERSYEVE